MQTTVTRTEPTTVGKPPTRSPSAPACLCGARTGRGQSRCRKCRNRERWYRRNRLHHDNRRRRDAQLSAALLMGGPR